MAEEKKRVIIAEPIPENVLIEAEEVFAGEMEEERTASSPLPAETEEVSAEEPPKNEESSAVAAMATAELFKKCILPDKTELQERILKTRNDILVGDHCDIGYGLYGNDVVVCEFCKLTGDVVAEGDLRIDNFCEINGTVICNGDAYLGEGVKVHGKLTVGGNLDIGDNVTIDKEFKALGDISIRNPMPVILYLLLYVMTMLHLDNEAEVEKTVNAIISEANSEPLVLPPRTTMDLRYFSVSTPMEVGANCRLHGNIKAKSISLKNDVTLFGGIHATRRVKIGERTAVHGDVVGQNIRIERGADILGDVAGDKVWLHEDALVSGIIRSPGGLTIGRFEEKKE
ncbi:polymer-forming cytoskeletal protein [Methanocorpusculum vombati]|uniref:Polymer-forming cytoskeletal protein n=1 Tax=Methanocorpusculum vombati TaxID=3002864 RepID=A0ABT4INQ4_9EURY|nr:polymer-forming cytoskeletal protein [Methanocorpusculum vombati]MCZ9320001.1 polymer-forming cytoskeletal protein [Methanocorpusculum sp.]MCZ0862954.1 polymer-forming cytoskeletal protein [Methanocorpusculum vombati]MDE2521375.1 polymer-forming cytoskeletal protein [Methanocorpusculum sp.]MDE2534526.1 polymer-forming cytoskeletal protein [Methanocorpusculum sp.]MDE2547094.1 polymer-forming cytoskeletal protein [Methanocorpusculum sp.]